MSYLQICPSCRMWMRDCISQMQKAQEADLVLGLRMPLQPPPPPPPLVVLVALVVLLLLLLVALPLLALDACLCGVAGRAPVSISPAAEPLLTSSLLSPCPAEEEEAGATEAPSSLLKSWTNQRKLKTCTEREPSSTKKSVSPNHQRWPRR